MASDMLAMERVTDELQKRYTSAEAATYIATCDANQLQRSLAAKQDVENALLARIRDMEHEYNDEQQQSQRRHHELEAKLRYPNIDDHIGDSQLTACK